MTESPKRELQTNNNKILNFYNKYQQLDFESVNLMIIDMYEKIIEKEIDRLSTMDEVKCKILGISKGEILNG